MSQGDIVRTVEDEFSYQGTVISPELTKPDTVPERTGSAMLARLTQPEDDGERRVVETLYKVVSENTIRTDTIILRLWRLWGPAQLEKDDVLVKCEYDSSTYEVLNDGILAAYRVLDCHYLNNHSSIARVRRVDTKTLGSETSPVEKAKQDFVVPPIVKSLQALLETLGSGGTLLLSLRTERSKETIDPQHFILVRLVGFSPIAFGLGPPPEDGTIWRVVERVTPEGLVETSMEYRVLTQSPSSSERGWKAELENTSDVRKVFSLVDGNRAP